MNSILRKIFKRGIQIINQNKINEQDHLIIEKISNITKKPRSEVQSYYKIIKNWKFLSSDSKYTKSHYVSIGFPEGLYIFCRLLKPKIVIETGVASGISSTYILKGLEDNDYGKLISIDKPNYNERVSLVIPKGKEIGWMVPKNLRNRWELKLGISQELLKPILDKISQIDIFLHDSEHTYTNMMFEFETVWPHLRNDGLLLSDDIGWNNAFQDFAKKVNRNYIAIIDAAIGAISK